MLTNAAFCCGNVWTCMALSTEQRWRPHLRARRRGAHRVNLHQYSPLNHILAREALPRGQICCQAG